VSEEGREGEMDGGIFVNGGRGQSQTCGDVDDE